jgi:hypothetical protein
VCRFEHTDGFPVFRCGMANDLRKQDPEAEAHPGGNSEDPEDAR